MFLTPEQRKELIAHLAGVIPAERIPVALVSLDQACSVDDRDWMLDLHRAKSAIAEHGQALLELLDDGKTVQRFLDELRAIVDDARIEAEWTSPLRRRPGRPADNRRAAIVLSAYRIYPRGAAKKTYGSHFEQTVAMLLRFIGHHITDVHGLIVRVLAEKPLGVKRRPA